MHDKFLYVCFKTTKEVNNEWLMQLLKTPKMNYYYKVNGEGGVRVLKTEDIHPPKTGISVHFSGSLV